MATREIDLRNGHVLYDDGEHQFIWLGWEENEGDKAVQVNQYLIINRGKGILLDPGGVYTFPRVISNLAMYISPDNIIYIIFSHQDPDVSSGAALWLNNTSADIYISKLWERFIPHFGIYSYDRIKPVPDNGMSIDLPSGDKLDIIPAHFLHSVGHINVFDRRSGVLFTGDIGAAVFSKDNKYLFVEDFEYHVRLMEGFHKRYMNGNAACRKWVDIVKRYNPKVIAPQHGAIFEGASVNKFLDWLYNLRCGLDIIDQIYGV